ncbi:MAG: hypothetical protein WBQ50_14035 [Nocardioides sp.]
MIEPTAAFALLASALGAANTVPYLRDTWRRSTVPHRGTWLIWTLLAVVAVEAQRADGARWSLLPLVTQALGTLLVFTLSLRLGTGGLTRAELGLIGLASAGVVGWAAVDEPTIAIGCVIAADLVAAAMMVPKTWRKPHSETLSTFVLAGLGGAMTVGAVGSLSVGLLAYPVYFTLVNAALAVVIAYRRHRLSEVKPASVADLVMVRTRLPGLVPTPPGR